MLECKEVRPFLAEYEAGTLPEEQAAQVADHLLLCPICAAALEDLRRAGDRPVTTAEALSPAAPRSLGTQDPLAEQKAAPVPEADEPAPAAVVPAEPAQVVESPLRKKLPRWGKVLIALGALVLVLGICAGVLWSMEAFSIRDWEKTDDGSFAAVIYAGAKADAKDGFRVRLWNGTKKEWHDEVAFLDAAYRKTVWSPNGRFAAVEFTDTEGHDRVYIIDINRLTSADLQTVLEGYLQQNDGYFDETPLVVAPDCRILQWLPDSNRLLIAAEGAVDTNIDPDYGIELASNWSLSVNNGAQTNIVIINGKAQTVSGYFAYEVDFFDIENIVGFGKQNKEITLGTLRTIAEEFRGTGIFGPPSDSNDIYCEEVYYQADALRELAMLPDSCRLEGIFHRMEMENNMYYIYDNWSHPDAKLTADRGVILFTNAQRTVAYVIVTP